QTAWFLFLCGVAGVGVLMAGFGWRVRRLTRKQRELRGARDLLEKQVRQRTTDLAAANASLKAEIEERTRMQQEIESVHGQLLDASRQAGMAEVATGVLHNVGNVLNSVNVSANLVMDRVRESKMAQLPK